MKENGKSRTHLVLRPHLLVLLDGCEAVAVEATIRCCTNVQKGCDGVLPFPDCAFFKQE